MLRELKDKIFILYLLASAVLILLPLAHVLYSVFAYGLPVLIDRGLEFLTSALLAPNRPGGIFPALFGTFLMVSLSSLFGVPLAILAGIFIAEYPRSVISNLARPLMLIMLEFPTILVGLFVMIILVIPMGTFSALAGSIALAIVMLPYVTTYTEQAMRSVPENFKEGAYALGLKRARVVFSVTMKMAKRGILTGMLIGIAKVAGETAPLIFTASVTWRAAGGINEPTGAIPIWIYYLIQQPYANYHEIAWGAALILMLIFLAIFLPVRLMMVRT
ncbi:MAG: phosphate ABC transporter permease PstA [Candidatus Methanoglobus sp.]